MSAATGPKPRLTARQLDILRRVAAGQYDAEIAAQLFVCTRTVKDDLKMVRARLDARNRTNAVARAYELGVLP